MARPASPDYSRVAGPNVIGSDTQEDGITSLPRAITLGAGAGSTGRFGGFPFIPLPETVV
jgi:hypothetical protein